MIFLPQYLQIKLKIGQWFPDFSYLRTQTQKNGNFRTPSKVFKENIAQTYLNLKFAKPLRFSMHRLATP